jgi:hypothetical protein
MLSINVFRAPTEQHWAKMRVWRATLIQRMRHLDSIIADKLVVGDFIDSIGHSATGVRQFATSALGTTPDIRLCLRHDAVSAPQCRNGMDGKPLCGSHRPWEKHIDEGKIKSPS